MEKLELIDDREVFRYVRHVVGVKGVLLVELCQLEDYTVTMRVLEQAEELRAGFMPDGEEAKPEVLYDDSEVSVVSEIFPDLSVVRQGGEAGKVIAHVWGTGVAVMMTLPS